MKPVNIALGIILVQLICTMGSMACRHRHRHRHRHRSRSRSMNQHVLNTTNLNEQQDVDAIHDETSILDTYRLDAGVSLHKQIQLNREESEQPSICTGTKSATMKAQILDSLERTLIYYDNHMDTMGPTSDGALGLAFLKAVDDKHGGRFQTSFPLSNWILEICGETFEDEKEFCFDVAKSWIEHDPHSWESDDVIKENQGEIELVGTEKEHLWGKLNGECQTAIVFHCEVPYVCERTLYDPQPRSMYFLTHQLLQRIFTEQSNCVSAKKLLNQQVNDQLCSKMYQEARLISQLGYPKMLRDVFSEYVGFCGYMGYPNFFREDWIENILSWQSKSEFGCFTDDNYKGHFVTSDLPVIRLKTSAELLQSAAVEEERCLPHFTSVAFSALAVSWDYMEANCK